MEWIENARKRLALMLEQPLAAARGREHAFLVVIAIILGILGAYGAIGFRYMISGVHYVAFESSDYNLDLLLAKPWWRRLLLPTIGGLSVGLIVARLATEVKGSGIPEVMESVSRRGGAIRARVVLTKAIAASLTIGTGGSAGREGPIAHIGSAIGSALGQFFQVSAKKLRTFVACGAAAGIAATFNAPIAGALFALEVVLGDMRVASMSPIVISSVVATVISRHHLGDFPAFRVPVYELLSARELLIYACLGIVAGIAAVIFIRLLYFVSDAFEKFAIPLWLKPAIGGLGVGIIALFLPHVFGVGYETINAALWNKASTGLLLGVLVGKLVATSLTLGSGGSGGIFAPSLFLGATLGSLWGQLATALFPGTTANPGAYALVGMGAVVSAATHAPITAILIIFEMTNDYRIIPPLMLTCVISVLISSQLNKESIYTEKLRRRGIRFFERRDVNLLRSIRVEEVMDEEIQLVRADLPLTELLPMLISGNRPVAGVVNAAGKYLGNVELGHIRQVILDNEDLGSLVVAADAADLSTPVAVPTDSLDWVMHQFGRTEHNELPVCDSHENGKVLGVVTKQAVIDAYNKRVIQEDLTGGFGSFMDTVRDGRSVEIRPGIQLAEVEVPTSWAGKTLKDVDIRRRYGVGVVLISRPDDFQEETRGDLGLFPSPEFEFASGDRVIVMGSVEQIKKLHH